MSFKSKSQERWAFANEMPFAQKWAKMTDQKALPQKKKKKKASSPVDSQKVNKSY